MARERKCTFGLVWDRSHPARDLRYPTKWDSMCYNSSCISCGYCYCTSYIYPFFSLDPLRKYDGETITLELPGDSTIFHIDWISIFDLESNRDFGSILIPDGLNVPPSLIKIQVFVRKMFFICVRIQTWIFLTCF